jgi:glycerophosphoryl diester phosphodiesterase
MMDIPEPVWVAHRGQSDNYPENTLAAVRAAFECGAQYVEIDVQCSSDGELFILHDALLDRTTDTSGSLMLMSSQQLQRVSAHEPERLGDAFIGEPVPRLSELVPLMADWPLVKVFVEIKRESIAIHGVDAILECVTRLLAPVRERCILISFDLAFVRTAVQDGLFATGWVLDAYDQATIDTAREFGPDYMIVDYCRVTDVSRLAEGGWQWMVYLVNEPGIVTMLSARNVQLIETSDICAMLKQA